MPEAIAGRRFRPIHLLRAASLACMLIGVLLIVTFAYGMWRGFSEQEQLNDRWLQQVGKQLTTPSADAVAIDHNLQQPLNGIDFAIRVPKLRYFAAVREGVSTTILYSGPGHYPGTVWPGNQGTVGVAAHNVYWINFPQLGMRDEIDIETRYGIFRYRVTGSRIVNPDDRTVLVTDSPGYHLVLTTCWPLWAGAFATKRYIVFAEQFYPRIIAPTYT
ncbi:MAG: class D sortase [Candidatus Dormibacteraeota bacterium]|nr:class D sortase [Candidatus Dormibacteraeota bacterium]